MVRTVELTQSVQAKLNKDGFFSNFIDDAMLDFKYSKCDKASYYYPGGNLIVSKYNNNITADWIPEQH